MARRHVERHLETTGLESDVQEMAQFIRPRSQLGCEISRTLDRSVTVPHTRILEITVRSILTKKQVLHGMLHPWPAKTRH